MANTLAVVAVMVALLSAAFLVSLNKRIKMDMEKVKISSRAMLEGRDNDIKGCNWSLKDAKKQYELTVPVMERMTAEKRDFDLKLAGRPILGPDVLKTLDQEKAVLQTELQGINDQIFAAQGALGAFEPSFDGSTSFYGSTAAPA